MKQILCLNEGLKLKEHQVILTEETKEKMQFLKPSGLVGVNDFQ